jgi:hypothetical protein
MLPGSQNMLIAIDMANELVLALVTAPVVLLFMTSAGLSPAEGSPSSVSCSSLQFVSTAPSFHVFHVLSLRIDTHVLSLRIDTHV